MSSCVISNPHVCQKATCELSLIALMLAAPWLFCFLAHTEQWQQLFHLFHTDFGQLGFLHSSE